VTLNGMLDSMPNAIFALQFFANWQEPKHPGQTYLGLKSVTTDGNGKANFSATFPLARTDVTFDVTATNAGGDTSEFPTTGALKNISTRGDVKGGDNVMIVGFILSLGRTIALRGIGPSLESIAAEERLADPVLQLFDDHGALLATNDNWNDDADAGAQLQALNLAPGATEEAAMIRFFPVGAYTAVLRGKNDSSGVGLVEAYDVTSSGAGEPLNLSTRGLVESGDKVLIGGCIINEPSGTSRVIVRALGPSLASTGISNSVSDPTLELHNSQGATIATNDNWRAKQQDEIIAANLAPSNDKEAAIVASLAPGAYTAIVRSKDNSAGVALVEIYNLH
jgi:hypothetical protein